MQVDADHAAQGHHDNNNLVNGLDSVKLRSTGSKHLPNGRLSPARERSPARRDLSPSGTESPSSQMSRADYERLKTLAQGAEDRIRELRSALRDVPVSAEAATSASWFANGGLRAGHGVSASPGGSPAAKSGRLRDKEFALRNSPLTDLFAVSHIATIYHVAVVVLIILVLKTLVHDLVSYGTVNLSVGLIWHCFGGFHRVITIWLVMKLAVMLQYAAFASWAQRRQYLPANSWQRRSVDAAAVVAVALFDAALLTAPVLRMLHHALPFASSFTLLTESVRLVMKSHAFVRSNAPRALRDGTCPGFSQFLYFMFAPTLVYSDDYPRTAQIRWRVVACHLLEVVGCIFYCSFLAERYVLPLFRDFGLRPMPALELLSLILACVLPSGLAFVCSFYMVLHSWQNAWAEMLRFGDRMFYKEWWNEATFSAWYRTWNVLVQDWLYTYVYRDVVLAGGNALLARCAVFFISAVVHEFILGFAVRFFYPALYVFFGIFGLCLSFMKFGQKRPTAVGNIFLWLSLFLGDGMLISFYTMEHFSRQNCAQTIDSSWDLVMPRSWSCVPLHATAHAARD